MNRISLLIILALAVSAFAPQRVIARDGYKIQLNFTDVTEESKIYLCHYFGKGGTVFKDDSTTLRSGKGMMRSKEKINGGIYILLFKDQTANMEIILQNGDDFSITTTKKNIIASVRIKGKTENDKFYGYQRFLVDYGKSFNKLKTAYGAAKTKDDSIALSDQMRNKGKELVAYRKGIIKRDPRTFMATLFRALAEPEVPEHKDWPVKADGSKDSTFPSLYYKKHYWDGYDFQDDRLIYTPMYEPKLKNYMDKWVIPMPDTVLKECKSLLQKAEGTKETYKYTLWYLTRWAETSKIMGMEEVFVNLVEDYYMQGKATWLDSAQLAKYEKRAGDIAPNMIGKPAKDIKVRNMMNQFVPLSSIKARYTLLVFWEADCGHCKKELPKLDSLYKRELYKYGLKIMAVESSNDVEKWKKFVKEKKLIFGWEHVYDPDRSTNFRSFYDVYVTPTIYLLDENKTIIGRRVNHSNILDVIKYHQEKKKEEQDKK